MPKGVPSDGREATTLASPPLLATRSTRAVVPRVTGVGAPPPGPGKLPMTVVPAVPLSIAHRRSWSSR